MSVIGLVRLTLLTIAFSMISPVAAQDNAARGLPQSTGKAGTFTIFSMGVRLAQFGFITSAVGSDGKAVKVIEKFDVTVGQGGNLEKAIVREMSRVIRTKGYDGDFGFESARLNRKVILSARPEDSESLEEFLLLEFFGKAPKKSAPSGAPEASARP